MRVFVVSYGCSTNLADGQVLAGCLDEAGYELVNCSEDADIIVFNTCAVKTPTENRMLNLLKHLPARKKIIVTGCLPLINFNRLRKEVRFNGAGGPAPGIKIVNLVQEVAKGKQLALLDSSCLHVKPDLGLPTKKTNPLVSVVPICYGCLGSCAYCCVRNARGKLRSYPIKDIIKRVTTDLEKGVKEFWFTGQDVGCYGLDLKSVNIVTLLKAVCEVKGDFHVRVGMMTPNRVLQYIDGLAGAYANFGEEVAFENMEGKIFQFLHLPLQSGDNEVLKNMGRQYDIAQFKRIIRRLRKDSPKLTVATDIIVGFPGESEAAFENTLEILEETKPDIVNVSKFFGRPETEASKMDPKVPLKIIKERSKKASLLTRETAFEANRLWVGWEGYILIDEVGKTAGSYVGRNYAYKPVVVKTKQRLFGKTINVKIVEAYSTYLAGEIISK